MLQRTISLFSAHFTHTQTVQGMTVGAMAMVQLNSHLTSAGMRT